jgi:Asp-tRNA(Asn)/Glu-tRNA(Gln) amidotransferase A subunit family amidase
LTDAALALSVLSDWTGMPEFQRAMPARLRVSVCRTPFWHLADAPAREILDSVARRLCSAGVEISEMTLPSLFDGLGQAHNTISDYEARQSLAHEWDHCRAELSAGVCEKLARGAAISEASYHEARRLVGLCRAAADQLFADCDCLLTPSAPGFAPLFADKDTGSAAFNLLWTTLGMPCVNLPVPAAGRLPIGIQIVAACDRDAVALQAAERIRQILHAP